jgi:hypothetical protein
MPTTDYDLVFDGEDDYIEIADDADFSVATTGQLTVSASIRPDALTFPTVLIAIFLRSPRLFP